MTCHDRPFGRPVYRFGCHNNGTQRTFFNVSFSYFNKKYVKVVINDFTMHLIISKWLRRQKCRQKSKTMRQEEVEVKEETV